MNEAITTSVWVTSPEYAGWLTKRGFAWRKLWRPKWVALHGAEIVYMEKEPTAANYGMKMTKAQLTASTKICPEDLEGNQLGFSLHFNDSKTPVWYLRAGTVREKKDWIMRLSHVMAIINWLENYEKVRVLGLGGTGIVYELLHKTNGTRFALKEIEIKNKAQMQVALQEAEMLKEIMENISHPNIMHIEKVFQVGSKFYLVFPLCVGGELYEHVIRRGKFTERDAATLTRSLASSIQALHSRDILHLDIKPENILFESLRDDSPIKLTDFGLSKFIVEPGSRESTEPLLPTVEEMDERLKDFSENGILNTVKLKGTVGYMAPELILSGHTSKATDVFAAGVVLYILLCGHPPFHSKSNREVLEKTARGVYRLDGKSWREVSEQAKDLVRRMLERDPAKRATAEEVLSHPWLVDSVEDDEDDDDAVEEDGLAEDGRGDRVADLVDLNDNGMPQSQSQRVPSNQQPLPTTTNSSKRAHSRNLSGLRLLSEHVAERRSEKFLSGLTNLVSFIQGGNSSGSKLIQFVHLANGQLLPMGGEDNHDSSSLEERFVFLNPYVRSALSGALRRACGNGVGAGADAGAGAGAGVGVGVGGGAQGAGGSDGRVTVEQFLSVLKKLGIASGLPGMFLCRFVDRDGDGFISADDLFTTQALVMQRSEVFLRVVFRAYCESVWYPGRQLNLVNYYQQQSTPKKRQSSSGGFRVMDDTAPTDVIEPPKFITARHVAEVFGKLGLDPEDGRSIFGVLCESLERLYAKERSPSHESEDSSGSATSSAAVSINGSTSNAIGGVGDGLRGVNSDSPCDSDNAIPSPPSASAADAILSVQASNKLEDPAPVTSPLFSSLSSSSSSSSFSSPMPLPIPAPSTSTLTADHPYSTSSGISGVGNGDIGGGGKASISESPKRIGSLSVGHTPSPSPQLLSRTSLSSPATAAAAAAAAVLTSSLSSSQHSALPPTPGTANALKSQMQAAKMDVADFVRASQLDDVLVQALLRRPRSGFLALVAKCKEADRASFGPGPGPAGTGLLSPAAANSTTTSGGFGSEGFGARSPSQVYTDPPSALEEELVAALLSARSGSGMAAPGSQYPIASAVARGTLSVLSGVQGALSAAADIVGGGLEGVRGMSAFGVHGEDSSDEDGE